MRTPALLLATLTGLTASLPAHASYETLTAKVREVTREGIVKLHDGSSLVLDKSVKTEGQPSAGNDVTITYSADENGYVIQTARFRSAPGATAN